MTELSTTETGSRHLVAPELLAALDLFPSMVVDDTYITAIRGGTVPSFSLPADLPPALAAIRREEHFIPGAPGSPNVRILVYTPPTGSVSPRSAILEIHGGGYVMGSAEISDASNRALVQDLDCVIVSVDYRLAPETRWPGALEDCYAALKWLHEQVATLGVDAARIAIMGGSAGGGHAAALALLARDRGEYPICFQMLHAPMLDDRTGSTSEPHPYAGEFIWTPGSNRFGWRALLGVEPGGADVPANAVPARAASLEGLPPTAIVVGALDLFLEEDMDYARRLIRAGVPTELHVIPGAYHGYGLAGPGAPLVRLTAQLQRDALARAFATQ
ncbi:MAG TPA: alpha/beta hydrolase [Sphingobium sp.]|uniref:alpha/beta hydrolase n=1 Tax=Sphingobium sp. TaxID=1912891 RepID=UPI002ED5A89E